MAKRKPRRQTVRLIIQAAFAALTNGYVRGFAEGKIFTGNTKYVCVPGLNCYSCPGALGACPIGALQATLGSNKYQFAFYVLGFLMIFGALFGRLVCGFLCPFGLVQDLLHRIPLPKKWRFPRKLKRLPGERGLRLIKYLLLILFVILLPMFVVDIIGQGKPWFCEYVCPSGTLLGGIPLVLLDERLRAAIGWLYAWKVAILAVIVLLSIIIYRPFCRYLCPLGAIYGLFNKISLARYTFDKDKCTRCGLCQKACGFDIKVFENPNSIECIRCGKCRDACPQDVIGTYFHIKPRSADSKSDETE